MIANFLTALGLVLVIEGIIPFLNPNLWRRTIVLLASQKDTFLRKFGLLSMLAGLLVIYLVHHLWYFREIL